MLWEFKGWLFPEGGRSNSSAEAEEVDLEVPAWQSTKCPTSTEVPLLGPTGTNAELLIEDNLRLAYQPMHPYAI